MDQSPGTAGRIIAVVIAIVVVIALVFAVIAVGAWALSFKGVDSGEIAFVREGGPFDGRSVSEVRQPGSKPKAIGAWNHQDALPVTERDLTDEVENITVPSKDGVDIVVRGQALFRLTTDTKRAKDFYLKFGRRKWNGQDLSSDEGWSAFLKLRLIPILQDTVRQSIGNYECVQLKNTCVYVLEADKLASDDATDVSDKAKDVNNTQVIQAAQDDITKLLAQKIKDGLGGDYFEGVRFQNLTPDFTPKIKAAVQAAQSKRADVATTKLEAQRVVEEGIGKRRAKEEEAKGLQKYANALKDPGVAEVEKIKALCGVGVDGTPKGCDNLQVIGGGSVINSLK
jgi:hypothetical protein